jgi:hypothetical protein
MTRIRTALFFVASLTIVGAPAALAQNYNPCSNPVQPNWCDGAPAGSDITLVSVALNPNPIKKGQKVTLTITSLDSKPFDVTKATFALVLYYGTFPVPVIATMGDGCPLLGGCPVKPYAPKTTTITFFVPPYFPSGTYHGQFWIVDQNWAGNVCLFGSPVPFSSNPDAVPCSPPYSPDSVIQRIVFDMPIS